MAPPTGIEQLIRDYLNRMSVAARDLAPDDRRALLERTRSLIEQKADLPRRPSTMDVGRVLARLGDPARRVEQERRRLASQGKSAQPATPATSVMPARQRFLGKALGRELGRLRGPSFRWPNQPDSRGGAPLAPSNGLANGIHQPNPPAEGESRTAAAVSAEPPAVAETHAEQSPPAPPPSAVSRQASAAGPAAGPVGGDTELPASSPPAVNGTVHATPAPPSAEPPQRQPPSSVARPGSDGTSEEPQPGAASPAAGTAGERAGSEPRAAPPAAGSTRSAGQSAAAAATTAAPSGRDAAGDRPADPRGRPPGSPRPGDRRSRHESGVAVAGPANRLLSRVLAWARKRPLEAAAIVLMGIGGPIFPPVFLIGGTLALASELWDGRDKWVGLALPVVLTVIGLAVGVAAGGRAHWMHESWVYLDVVSRVAPALGAAYLAWRSQQPRRPSAVPPFSTPRRVS